MIPRETVFDRVLYRTRKHNADFPDPDLTAEDLDEHTLETMSRLELLEAISEAIEQRLETVDAKLKGETS